MPRNSDDDLESIVSLEDEESEVETKIKLKTVKKKETIPEGYVPIEISKKTGRPKRIMSEKQKLALAECRKKGREKRGQLSALRKEEKNLKKDDLLIKTLEVKAKVKEHKARLQQLAIKAGYECTEEEKKKIIGKKTYKKRDHLKDDDFDKSKKDEIEDLQNQLKALQKKHKIIESDNSESEVDSDSEAEEYVKPQKPIKKVVDEKERIPVKKPIFKKDPIVPPEKSRKKNIDPFANKSIGNLEDKELQKALTSLFC